MISEQNLFEALNSVSTGLSMNIMFTLTPPAATPQVKYITSVPPPGTISALYFVSQNITEFIKWYEDMCSDHSLSATEWLWKLSKYCEFVIGREVKILSELHSEDWEDLKRVLQKEYEKEDVDQQINSWNYLEVYKNKKWTMDNDLQQYC